MRYFQSSDMVPGLTIHVPQRHTIYRVLEINGEKVKYTSARGTDDWRENEMETRVFVQGMEEMFALVAEVPTADPQCP